MVLLIRTTGIEDYLDGGEANIKCLIMGAPSAGKTRSASYWPDPIFADCEKGRMSIADRSMPYAEIKTIDDMDSLLSMLALECRKPPPTRRYKTLVIDTIDAYQRIVVQKRLDDQKKEALSGWGDWGYLDAKMTQFIAKLHQLPMNIVVNLHVKTSSTGDDENKVETIGPKLKGDLKDQIAAEFDLVGYMGTFWEAEEGERVLKRGIQWWPEPNKPILKDRSGQLPKWTEVTFSDEDFAGLMGHLVGAMDGMAESMVLEELESDPEVTHAPVAPLPGGAVPGAPLAPAKRAVAAKKAAAAPAVTPARLPPASSSAASSAASSASSVPPTSVVAEASQPAPPGPAAEPENSGADQEPEASSTDEASVPVALPEQAAEPVAEAVPTEAEAISTVQEALGGEVISETTAADAATPTVEAAVQEKAADWPLCGTSSTEGEEGQPGTVPGCGTPVDPDESMTQIGIFKTRTFLCPADFAAWRATNRK